MTTYRDRLSTEGEPMRKPSVKTKCVSNYYTGPNERIVEFSSAHGGGLIALRDDGERLAVDVYRIDDTVDVRCPQTASLLDACKTALWYYEHFHNTQPQSPTELEDISRVRAAIAKAERKTAVDATPANQ